jgi:hypothetical protein
VIACSFLGNQLPKLQDQLPEFHAFWATNCLNCRINCLNSMLFGQPTA